MFDRLMRGAVRLVPYRMRRQIKTLPLVGPAQRFIVNRHLSGKPFVHTVDAGPARGITFELVLPEDKGIWTGTYEPDFAARVAAEVRPGMIGYDVGSWHGYFAGIMLANGAREVTMFEPLPRNRARLERLVALNPGRCLGIAPVALGERDGSATLVSSSESSMARLADSPFDGDAERAAGETLTVSVRTLDGLVAERGLAPPDILKIDVEGAEAMMLRGAERTLATAHPVVLAEVHSAALMAEVRAILERHRYRLETLDACSLGRAAGAAHVCARPDA